MKKQKFFNFKLNENKDLSNFYVNETNAEAFKTLDESKEKVQSFKIDTNDMPDPNNCDFITQLPVIKTLITITTIKTLITIQVSQLLTVVASFKILN